MSTTFEVRVGNSVGRFDLISVEDDDGETRHSAIVNSGILGKREDIAWLMERIATVWPKSKSCLKEAQ